MSSPAALVRVRGLKKYFPIQRGLLVRRDVNYVRAVDGLTFDILRGETLGLVGESGCGKTTAGRSILQIHRPTAGQVLFEKVDLTQQKGQALRDLREHIQMIFQDPYASLNPRWTIGRIIADPLRIHHIGTAAEQRDRPRPGNHAAFHRLR